VVRPTTCHLAVEDWIPSAWHGHDATGNVYRCGLRLYRHTTCINSDPTAQAVSELIELKRQKFATSGRRLTAMSGLTSVDSQSDVRCRYSSESPPGTNVDSPPTTGAFLIVVVRCSNSSGAAPNLITDVEQRHHYGDAALLIPKCTKLHSALPISSGRSPISPIEF
jgi:hypothetical protein